MGSMEIFMITKDINKDYTKLFLAMYNAAYHVCKTFNNINTYKPVPLEYDGYEFNLLSYSSNSLYRYCSIKENVSFIVYSRSVEYDTAKEIRINYFDDTWKTVQLIKELTDLDDANYYLRDNDGSEHYFPLTKDVVFNLNMSNFPITLYPGTYNTMMKNLDKEPFNIFFNMDI